MSEYVINQDKYIQVMLLYEFLVSYVGIIIMFGSGITILIYVTHVCALLEITR